MFISESYNYSLKSSDYTQKKYKSNVFAD